MGSTGGWVYGEGARPLPIKGIFFRLKWSVLVNSELYICKCEGQFAFGSLASPNYGGVVPVSPTPPWLTAGPSMHDNMQHTEQHYEHNGQVPAFSGSAFPVPPPLRELFSGLFLLRLITTHYYLFHCNFLVPMAWYRCKRRAIEVRALLVRRNKVATLKVSRRSYYLHHPALCIISDSMNSKLAFEVDSWIDSTVKHI